MKRYTLVKQHKDFRVIEIDRVAYINPNDHFSFVVTFVNNRKTESGHFKDGGITYFTLAPCTYCYSQRYWRIELDEQARDAMLREITAMVSASVFSFIREHEHEGSGIISRYDFDELMQETKNRFIARYGGGRRD
jgi:hypothetical protein